MSKMVKLFDGNHWFQGASHGTPGKCRLRIFAGLDRPTLLVVTEVPDNPGASAATATVEIVRSVLRKYRLRLDGILFVETCGSCEYDGRRRQEPEIVELIEFRTDDRGRIVACDRHAYTRERLEYLAGGRHVLEGVRPIDCGEQVP